MLLGFRIIYPSFITSNYWIQQIWFILNALRRSKHNSLQCSFCSSDSTFGTIFAQTFLTFNSSLRIRWTLSLSKLTSSGTAWTPSLWSFQITSHTFSVFFISNSCVWTAWAIIIFQAFSAFRKSFVPFRHMCMTCNLHHKPQSIIEKFPSWISSV